LRASRLLSLLMLLQHKGRMTAEALAETFEVSVRTIYRDVDQLSAAGVPVYADRGPGGGFALLDGYRTRLTGLTAAEAETLFLAGLPGAAAELGLGEASAAARLKLLSALPGDLGGNAARVADRFHLDPVDWYRRVATPPYLPRIAEAVWGERQIVIRYESWSATVRRRLDPLGLVMKAGAWYLVARCNGAIRTYRIDNVEALEVTDDGFVRPKGFDLGAHWMRELKRFEAGLRRGEAEIRVAAAALRCGRPCRTLRAGAGPSCRSRGSSISPASSSASAPGSRSSARRPCGASWLPRPRR
jgi:predicted DNA-binding transcriptional regulator YafY